MIGGVGFGLVVLAVQNEAFDDSCPSRVFVCCDFIVKAWTCR
jgi:hypothetical protein